MGRHWQDLWMQQPELKLKLKFVTMPDYLRLLG
jgi:hypothetical protein